MNENENTPAVKVAGYEVTIVNCPDRATARATAEKRLCEIEQRLAELKEEKTALNRHKHLLARLLQHMA